MKTKISIIGCGYWGPNLLRSCLTQPDAEVTAVADNSSQRRFFVQTHFPGIRTVDSPEVAIDLADAVIVSTPAETHYPLADKALAAGKHVLVEKPLARTVREVDELGRLALAAGKILMAGHTFLYHNAVQEVRRMIVAGELGEVRYIYSQRLNLGRVRSDVDALWNFAPHDVSILQYWTGGKSPSKITRSGMAFLQPGVEDVCFLSLEYPGGPLGHIHVSWLDPIRTRRMVVVGSHKMAVYDDVAEKKLAIHDKGVDVRAVLGEKMDYDLSGQPNFAYKDGEVRWPHIPWEEPLKVQVRHFLKCIRTGEEPLTGVRHAREVVAILESAGRK